MLSSYALTQSIRTFIEKVPLIKRLGRPEEFSQFVEDIVKNPMLNGEVLHFSGGLRQFNPPEEFHVHNYAEENPNITVKGPLIPRESEPVHFGDKI